MTVFFQIGVETLEATGDAKKLALGKKKAMVLLEANGYKKSKLSYLPWTRKILTKSNGVVAGVETFKSKVYTEDGRGSRSATRSEKRLTIQFGYRKDMQVVRGEGKLISQIQAELLGLNLKVRRKRISSQRDGIFSSKVLNTP